MMKRGAGPMRELTREEEIELPRIANQSLTINAKLAHLLVQFKLVEPFKDGWHLTSSESRLCVTITIYK